MSELMSPDQITKFVNDLTDIKHFEDYIEYQKNLSRLFYGLQFGFENNVADQHVTDFLGILRHVGDLSLQIDSLLQNINKIVLPKKSRKEIKQFKAHLKKRMFHKEISKVSWSERDIITRLDQDICDHIRDLRYENRGKF